MIDEEHDTEMLNTIEEDNKTIQMDLKSLSIYLLFNKPYDKNNCIAISKVKRQDLRAFLSK